MSAITCETAAEQGRQLQQRRQDPRTHMHAPVRQRQRLQQPAALIEGLSACGTATGAAQQLVQHSRATVSRFFPGVGWHVPGLLALSFGRARQQQAPTKASAVTVCSERLRPQCRHMQPLASYAARGVTCSLVGDDAAAIAAAAAAAAPAAVTAAAMAAASCGVGGVYSSGQKAGRIDELFARAPPVLVLIAVAATKAVQC